MDDLIGLSRDEFTEAMLKDSRAFQAVRGAIAEAHLENYLKELVQRGEIASYEANYGDTDKDFIVDDGHKKQILECKNVEVIKPSTNVMKRKFIWFSKEFEYFDPKNFMYIYNNNINDIENYRNNNSKMPASKLPPLQKADSFQRLLSLLKMHRASVTDYLFNSLPDWLRTSGYPRYHFSAHLAEYPDLESLNVVDYIECFCSGTFGQDPSVDFQRTRNSTDSDVARYYDTSEVDLLGVCMFSRSTEWSEFLFTADMPRLSQHEDKYSNRVTVGEGKWTKTLTSLI